MTVRCVLCEGDLGAGEADSHNICEAEFARRSGVGKCVVCGERDAKTSAHCGPCDAEYLRGAALVYRGYPPGGSA